MNKKVKDYLKRDLKAFGTTMKEMAKWYLIIGGLMVLGSIGIALVTNLPVIVWMILGTIGGVLLVGYWLWHHPGGIMMGVATLVIIWILCYILFGVFHFGAPS
jgi:hypothetical protein